MRKGLKKEILRGGNEFLYAFFDESEGTIGPDHGIAENTDKQKRERKATQ